MLLLFTNLCISQDINLNNDPSSNNKLYLSEKQSVAGNGFKSLLLPGWGNLERRWVYGGIEIGTISLLGLGLLSASLNNDGSGHMEAFAYLLLSSSVLVINHIVAPIDAINSTAKFNNNLKKKYKLSFSPTYNPKNNGVGIGFAVNF